MSLFLPCRLTLRLSPACPLQRKLNSCLLASYLFDRATAHVHFNRCSPMVILRPANVKGAAHLPGASDITRQMAGVTLANVRHTSIENW